jgi:hypothetical protein
VSDDDQLLAIVWRQKKFSAPRAGIACSGHRNA